MKKTCTLFSLVAVLFLFIAPTQSFGQTSDTLWIKAHPIGNINNVINADTTSTGARAHSVYALYRDSVYLYTATIVVNGDIKVVGASGTTRPPVIAPSILSDNSSPSLVFKLAQKHSNATFRNLYFLGVRADQSVVDLGSGIQVYADSIKLTVDSVVFDAIGNAAITTSGVWDKFFVSNCVFRNGQHPTQWFYGKALDLEVGQVDTAVIVNNTMFAMSSYAYCITSYNSYLKFEHNTIYINMDNPLNIFTVENAVVKNNIFYAVEAQASDPAEIVGWYYDIPGYTAGIISIDTSISGCTPAFTNFSRTFAADNNAYFWPKKLTDFYTAYNDTVTKKVKVGDVDVVAKLSPAVWMNDFSAPKFADKTKYPGLSESNNVNTDPGFNSTVEAEIDKAIQFVAEIKNGSANASTYWQFLPTSGVLFPPTWPLPEDFTYTNTTLQSAGTDGFALGDLNWYPAQHKQWTLTDVKVDKGAKVPTTFALSNAYPNPFNPTTNIQFNIAKSENIKLVVFNILGQQVKTLVNGEMKAGSYTATWNGKDEFGKSVASGIYFYRLESQSFNSTKKMILMK
jgi:hypothetical protein